MSRSCSRVISPAPARSILMTSAPNQASSCVHVGPDCTCVKSRIFTPSSALPIARSLFLLQRALRIEIADTAAFAAGLRVDHGVDQRRLAGVHRRVHGAPQLV